MINYMEKMRKQRNRLTTLSGFRAGLQDLEERFEGDELECEILEYVTVHLYTDYGFAGWWLRNRACRDYFLQEAEQQVETGGYPEDIIERAFFDTLVNDVIDYLGCKNQDAFMDMKYNASRGIYAV